jgi:hypothetical protein
LALVTGIDHLIMTVRDLDAAVMFTANTLGLHISGGGSHPSFGTVNRIIVLGGEYVELLSAQPDRIPTGLVGGMLGKGDGLAACILGVSDATTAAMELASRGIAVEGPTEGLLEAGPNFTRGWKTIVPIAPSLPGIPFLIKHHSDGQERRRLLAGEVGLAPHPIGAVSVASVTFAVSDLARSAQQFQQVLDISPGGEEIDVMLQAVCLRLTLPSGCSLVLAAPRQADSGPIAANLRERGEGVFAFELAVEDLPRAVRELRGRGIGVRVEEPNGILVSAQLNHRNVLNTRIGLVQA